MDIRTCCPLVVFVLLSSSAWLWSPFVGRWSSSDIGGAEELEELGEGLGDKKGLKVKIEAASLAAFLLLFFSDLLW